MRESVSANNIRNSDFELHVIETRQTMRLESENTNSSSKTKSETKILYRIKLYRKCINPTPRSLCNTVHLDLELL